MRKSIGETRSILRPPAFAYRRTAARSQLALFCEQTDLARLAARHGTPLYVYSAEAIRTRLRAFSKAFRSIPHTLCYSVKANSTLAILRFIARQGSGFDVVSGGELERVLRINPKAAASVVFSGVGKTVPEMELALQSGILLFNVESASELRALAAIAARLKKNAQIALRVNPDVSAKTHPYISTGLHEHKFGVPIPEARGLYAEAAMHPNLKVAGVSVHIGSQIMDLTSFSDALERVAELVRELRRAGHSIKYVDAGGGLGIPYHGVVAANASVRVEAGLRPALDGAKPRPHTAPHKDAPHKGAPLKGAQLKGAPPKLCLGGFSDQSSAEAEDLIAAPLPFADQVSAYAKAVLAPLRKLDVHLLLEPGRSIVGPAGALLTQVLYRKTNDGKRFLIVDAAMNDLLRPSLYGAYHEIVPVVRSADSAAKDEATDIVGPVCETGDFFARDRELPAVSEGETLAILDAGAYGMVLASNYNTRPRPAEVLVAGKSAKIIRRREKVSDLLRAEL